MNEESHVRGCCNITLLQPVRKQCKLSSNRITTHTRAGTSKTNQNKKRGKMLLLVTVCTGTLGQRGRSVLVNRAGLNELSSQSAQVGQVITPSKATLQFVSRFGLAVRRQAMVSGRTSVRYRFGSPFSSKVVVCGHCLVTNLSLTIMKHQNGSHVYTSFWW